MAEEHWPSVFFAAHPDPMWIYDVPTFQVVAVNDAAITAYGYTREQFLALTANDIQDKATLKGWDQLGDQPIFQTQAHHRLASGQIKVVEVSAQRLEYRGRAAVLVSARSMTRLLELEQAEAAVTK